MGEVYLAQHPRLPRRDALKILSSAVSADTVFRERFTREADIAATLSHPNIVAVYDRGEFEGQLWIAMEYVDGTDAARLVHDRYPAGMPADEAVEIFTAVAGALDYAHHQGLLHRDVKPANILLSQPDDDGQRRVFLADFGIARELADPSGLTATNLTVGTVAYAAPEQLMGSELDGRADNMLWPRPLFTYSPVRHRTSIRTRSPSSASISTRHPRHWPAGVPNLPRSTQYSPSHWPRIPLTDFAIARTSPARWPYSVWKSTAWTNLRPPRRWRPSPPRGWRNPRTSKRSRLSRDRAPSPGGRPF